MRCCEFVPGGHHWSDPYHPVGGLRVSACGSCPLPHGRGSPGGLRGRAGLIAVDADGDGDGGRFARGERERPEAGVLDGGEGEEADNTHGGEHRAGAGNFDADAHHDQRKDDKRIGEGGLDGEHAGLVANRGRRAKGDAGRDHRQRKGEANEEGDGHRHDKGGVEVNVDPGERAEPGEFERGLQPVIEGGEGEHAGGKGEQGGAHDPRGTFGGNRGGRPGEPGDDARPGGSRKEHAPGFIDRDVVAKVERQGDNDPLDHHGLDGEDGEGIAGGGRALEDAERVADGRVVGGAHARRVSLPESKGKGERGKHDAGGERPGEHGGGTAEEEKDRGEEEHAGALARVLERDTERVAGGPSLATEDTDHRQLGWRIDLGNGGVGEHHRWREGGGIDPGPGEADHRGSQEAAKGHAPASADAVGKRTTADTEDERCDGGGDQQGGEPNRCLPTRAGHDEEGGEEEILGDLGGETGGIIESERRGLHASFHPTRHLTQAPTP